MQSAPDHGPTSMPPDPIRSDGTRPARRRRRYVLSAALLLSSLLIGSGFFIGGFLSFTDKVARVALQGSGGRADGIVALTGGADRVSEAVELLTSGKARRLLISGVHPATDARQISRVVSAGPSLFDCCVDLDHRAANTMGNATETAKWARRNGFASLIVVTSAYHMPRALAELAHAMPGVELIAYPVARPTLELDRWYGNPATLSLLLEEYVKYIASSARLSIAGEVVDAVSLAERQR